MVLKNNPTTFLLHTSLDQSNPRTGYHYAGQALNYKSGVNYYFVDDIEECFDECRKLSSPKKCRYINTKPDGKGKVECRVKTGMGKYFKMPDGESGYQFGVMRRGKNQ